MYIYIIPVHICPYRPYMSSRAQLNEQEIPKIPGSCFCGAIEYEITLPTLFAGHCHCSMCRRIHAAAYVTWLGVRKESLKIIKGEEHVNTFHSTKGKNHIYRRSCKICTTNLFCDNDIKHPTYTDVSFASITRPETLDRQPEAHWYYTDHASWASTDATDGLKRIETDVNAKPGEQMGGKGDGIKILKHVN